MPGLESELDQERIGRAEWSISRIGLTDSSSQVSVPTTQETGRMVSELAGDSSEEYWRERASGLTFLEPGQ